MKWEILGSTKGKGEKQILNVLLKNRGLKAKKEKLEFFKPKNPSKITLKELEIDISSVKKAIKRIKEAKKKKEFVIVYGDYDADGICATGVMWEALHEFGLEVLPYIPDRFSEGYGINSESVSFLKEKYPNLALIVTVDNGIVANLAIDTANKLGIDVIISDHHQKGKKLPNALSIIHTDKICGSAVAYIFARELIKKVDDKLELAAIGTISDQMPLIGINRSLVKYGLEALNETKRPGLKSLFRQARIEKVGTNEVNYMIAPRINAMGRLEHGLDSLRLLCTKDVKKAEDLALNLGRVNIKRQGIVEEVISHARLKVTNQSVIVLASEEYHEGVIGLAAGKLVEEFYRPAIVISSKGKISKASARSISGFNIIEAIRKLEGLYLEGGGHPMAAGFSIETEKIAEFSKKINELSKELLTEEILSKKLRIDLEIGFENITQELYQKLTDFNPTGLGNPTPSFLTRKAELLEARTVGQGEKHLKLKLKQNEQTFDAIYFGGGNIYSKISPQIQIDVVYAVDDNTWNGNTSLQLKIRDCHLPD